MALHPRLRVPSPRLQVGRTKTRNLQLYFPLYEMDVRELVHHLKDGFDLDGESVGQRGETERAAGVFFAIVEFPEHFRGAVDHKMLIGEIGGGIDRAK